MLFQILSVDGVSVSPTAGMTNQQKKEIGGAKFEPEACPNVESAHETVEPLCTRRLHMMPGSRVEVWVAYRDANDSLTSPPSGAFAIFRTNGYQTGPSGDDWPTVDLARVEFQGALDADMPKALDVNGEANALLTPTKLAGDMLPSNQLVKADPTCKPLPPGHMRRIFYGVPTDNLNAFGLGYEEIDEQGNVVGTPATDVTPFDPMKPTVCVPLGPGNAPVTERWQIVNVATEDHNFHIHQVKFRVLTQDELGGTILPKQVLGKGVMLDNFPLPHANGTCGNNPPSDPSNPIADWRNGACSSPPITIEIPFAIAGDFVYHCHILEHEDGGMMARIRVRPTP
jgi:FtsP/CotA-like multicopper oxidase with cupredoxin domain